MRPDLARRRRQRLNSRGIGLPGDNRVILDVARRLQIVVDAPVLGGIAAILHGYLRTTTDLDFYTPEREITYEQLRAAGARWDNVRRQHVMDYVAIHTVTPEDARHVVRQTFVIDGVRVVSLSDLVAIKLFCGLGNVDCTKHVADVEELVRRRPLDKRFARKLPAELGARFKSIVDAVRAGERQREDKPRF